MAAIRTATDTIMAAITIAMTETTALLRLMTWLSPAFPVGSFAYSHGLETAIAEGTLRDAGGLQAYIVSLLTTGSAWNDALLLKAAWETGGDAPRLGALCKLGGALAGSAERWHETMAQGRAFLDAARAWPHPVFNLLPDECPYPVAVGAIASAHGVTLEPTLTAWLHAFASNLVQVAVRLVPLGQSHGVAVLASLEPVITETALRAVRSSLDDLGSATILSEIAAMRHETIEPRVFRT